MATLELANDYVNTEWEEFEEKYKDSVRADVMEYLHDHLDHRALWKGVPLSSDGKVQLRDGRTGEMLRRQSYDRSHALSEAASSGRR